MLTKTQIKIMQFFTSKITKRVSLREVSRELKMHQALTYRSSKQLIKEKLILIDDEKYVLNYKLNHEELSFFEHLRTKEFLKKSKNKIFKLFLTELIEKFPFIAFSVLLFGSAVISNKPRDIDVLIIIEQTTDIELAEKITYNIARNYTLNLHVLVVSFESVFEMLSLRDDKNIMNEILNKHLILYGGELFYKLLKKGRR